MENTKFLLVLCVDRDNDIGTYLNIETPIIGEENVLNAAIKYATINPEDSDANAMFAAIQTYRELKKIKNDKVEVAVIAGLPEEGIKGDIKLLKEFDSILSQKPIEGVVLISDGPTDEQVIPLIQSRTPIVSVRRVIVQQSRGIEESFVLVLRYMRRLVEDERYRKYTLGIPGIFIMLYVFLSNSMPNYAWPLLIFLFGATLFFKGFSLDETFKKMYTTQPTMFTSTIISILLLFLAFVGGLTYVNSLPGLKLEEVLGYFLLASIGGQIFVADLITIAVAIPLTGKILDSLMHGRETKISDYGLLAFVVISRQILVEVSKIMIGKGNIINLLYWILGGIVVMVLETVLSIFIKKKTSEAET
ncbi:MAG: DUF373 family protein [Thermoproteales archaeon]|nr:DUF373 family protein [Thermoproteales archaeon]